MAMAENQKSEPFELQPKDNLSEEKQSKLKTIQELQVLKDELKTLKKDAKVYKQQPNSCIFFREDKLKVLSEATKSLDHLIQEYKTAEKNSGDNTEKKSVLKK